MVIYKHGKGHTAPASKMEDKTMNDQYGCCNHTDTLPCSGRCETCFYGYLLEDPDDEIGTEDSAAEGV